MNTYNSNVFSDDTAINGNLKTHSLTTNDMTTTTLVSTNLIANDIIADTVTANNFIDKAKPNIKVVDTSKANKHGEISIEVINGHVYALVNLQLLEIVDISFNQTTFIEQGTCNLAKAYPFSVQTTDTGVVRVELTEDTYIHSFWKDYDIRVSNVQSRIAQPGFVNLLFNASPSKTIASHPSINYILAPAPASCAYTTSSLPVLSAIPQYVHCLDGHDARIINQYGGYITFMYDNKIRVFKLESGMVTSTETLDHPYIFQLNEHTYDIITRERYNLGIAWKSYVWRIDVFENNVVVPFSRDELMKTIRASPHPYNISCGCDLTGGGYYFATDTRDGSVFNVVNSEGALAVTEWYPAADILGNVGDPFTTGKQIIRDRSNGDTVIGHTHFVGDYSESTSTCTKNCVIIHHSRYALSSVTYVFDPDHIYVAGGLYDVLDAYLVGDHDIRCVTGNGHYVVANNPEEHRPYPDGRQLHVISDTVMYGNNSMYDFTTASLESPTEFLTANRVCTVHVDINKKTNTIITDQTGRTTTLADTSATASASAGTNSAATMSTLRSRYV